MRDTPQAPLPRAREFQLPEDGESLHPGESCAFTANEIMHKRKIEKVC
jgi:hypothetical protein